MKDGSERCLVLLIFSLLGCSTIAGSIVLAPSHDFGTEGSSVTADILMATGVPSAPLDLRAEITYNGVLLTWKQPLDSGGSNVTSYNIYVQIPGSSKTFEGNIDSANTTFLITNLTNAYSYEYSVAAVNSAGEEGARSWALISGPADAPSNVTDLMVYPGVNSVSLTWRAPKFDGGSPIIQYAVYRSTSLNGDYTLIGMTKNTYYKDNSSEGGTRYYYCVSCGNAVGFGENGAAISVIPFQAPISELVGQILLVFVVPAGVLFLVYLWLFDIRFSRLDLWLTSRSAKRKGK